MTFEELVTKRKNWVKSSVENNFDFDSILAGLYNDPSHFIFELLQNAEDEGATEVGFELFEDKLDFYHNGKDFDLNDIDGVTGIGISKKKDDLTSIGKFGVGFKSVFAITETPFIFSGDFRIKIDDFVVPSVIEDGNYSNTLIRLPFNHKTRSASEVFQMISKKLKNINLKTMLFLKNIEEIKWKTPDSEGQYLREAKAVDKFSNVRKVTIISSSNTEEFLVVEKPISIEEKNLMVEVAYKLGKDENGKEIIIPENDSKLVVYFPTEKSTNLHFIIQGPYKTTPNRENIPLDDSQNQIILEETAKLVSESLLILKDLGYLDTNLLILLPRKTSYYEYNAIYKTMFDTIKETIIKNELLPIKDGGFCKPAEALLARGKDLTEFLDSTDLEYLYTKKYWLDTNITYDRTRELRDYLINELDIMEVDFENFARRISKEFLSRKSDEWIIDFYTRLLEQPALWADRTHNKGILRNKPIIRLGNNEHIAPFNSSGKPNVYLPADSSSSYKTVKPILTQNEKALKFLKELGLTKPDLFAEINEFILPKYQKENPSKDENYFKDFEKLLTGFETISLNKLAELKDELRKSSFILAIKNCSDQIILLKPNEVYFRTLDLEKYFEGNDSIYFVSDELYQNFEKEKLNSFLIELGVEDKPRRIKIEKNAELSWEEIHRRVRYTGRNITHIDYDYEGLSSFILEVNSEKSFLLWRLLLSNIESLNSWEAREFFEGKLEYFYQTQHSESRVASFANILKQNAWLVDKNNILRKPTEITFSELSDHYLKESPNLDVLKRVLGFKPEIFEQLPEKEKRILEITAKYNLTPEYLEKLISEKRKESSTTEENKWTPTVEPESVTGSISESEPDMVSTPDLTNQSTSTDSNQGGAEEPTSYDTMNTDADDETTTLDRQSIGKWGEEFVFYSLKKKYQNNTLQETETGFTVTQFPEDKLEVVWLNKNGNSGKGYDYIIKKNDVEIEYIEVKTKTKDSDELIKVTGVQWEIARKLYDRGEGDKYCFYLVKNAGEENAEIKVLRNPIKLWKEGKLYAHPVNFKL